MNRTLLSVIVPGALLAVLATAAGLMASSYVPSRPPARQAAFIAESVILPDVRLTDHHGRSRALLSEMIGDDLVVVTFNYTTCLGLCGVGNGVMIGIDEAASARLKRPVRLVSVTINPLADTPDVLAKAVADLPASERWLWVTGDPADVDAVLLSANAKVADIESHDLVFIVGDGRRGTFRRLPAETVTVEPVLAALAEYDS